MLLLVTIGLVLLGAVFFVIGLISEALWPFYVTIAASVLAGVVLIVYSRMGRRPAPASAAAPGGWAPPPSTPPTGGGQAPAWSPPPPTAAPEPTAWTPPAPPAAPEPASATDTLVDVPAVGTLTIDEESDFPIADYDALRVSEILPLLPELDLEELETVREREQRGKNRLSVINRINERIAQLEAEDARGGPTEQFPIADYDQLDVEQILPLLDELDDDELDMVAEREERGQNRDVILDAIDDMFEPEEVPVGVAAGSAGAQQWAPPPLDEAASLDVPPPLDVPPVRKAGVKKAGVKKAGVKKAGVKEAGVKEAGVKKAGVKKAGAKKAGAKKAGAKKAGAKKAGAKKVVVVAGGPSVKEAGVKKTGVKKAGVKKAGVQKAGAKKAGAKKTSAKKTSAKKTSARKAAKASKLS